MPVIRNAVAVDVIYFDDRVADVDAHRRAFQAKFYVVEKDKSIEPE